MSPVLPRQTLRVPVNQVDDSRAWTLEVPPSALGTPLYGPMWPQSSPRMEPQNLGLNPNNTNSELLHNKSPFFQELAAMALRIFMMKWRLNALQKPLGRFEVGICSGAASEGDCSKPMELIRPFAGSATIP